MHVELLQYDAKNTQGLVLGTVSAVDGEIRIEGDVPERIQKDIRSERAHTKISNEAFLLKLTRVFSGAYYRARLIR